MITCTNCGAQIEEDVTKCPYCGYINYEGAKKQYMEELGEIKNNLAMILSLELRNHPKEFLTPEEKAYAAA